jgi:chromosome segregation protein
MALLKRVELLGFKSFPERTIVDFSAGISAVVGPNGCGKSNVVDAIRWALGEQNPRALRAERMEDVIFGGTEDRSRVGVAEVTLVLENDDQSLPIDVTEVELRRRLYRSGESEYLVNRQPVLLRDLRELFLDTGVGKNAYSVMEQGRIDLLLSAKPEERRPVFEEAAGIARYGARGVEAERKLQQTRRNMSQIEAIIAEVKRSRDVLADQVERANQYRSLQERVFGAERDLELIRLRELETRHSAIRRDLAKAQARHEELRAERSRALEAVQHGERHIRTMEAEVVELKRQLYGVDLTRGNTRERMATTRERIGEIERSVAGYRDRDRGVVAKIAELELLRDSRRSALQATTVRLEELHDAHTRATTAIDDIEQRMRRNDEAVEQAGSAVRDGDQRLEELRARLRDITDNIVASLDSRLQAVGYSPEARAAAEQNIARLLRELAVTLTPDAGGAEDAARRLELARRQVQELEGLIQSYGQLASAFIDDFLSPRGIVTRKRRLDEELGTTMVRIAAARGRAEAGRRANHELADQLEQLRRQIRDLQVERARNHTRKESLSAECERIDREVAEQQGRRRELANDERGAAQAVAAITAALEDLESQQARLEQEDRALRERLAELDAALRGAADQQVNLQQSVQKLDEKLERSTDGVGKLQLRDAEVATEIRTVLRNFQETHAQDLSQYELDITQTESRGELRATLARLREQVRRIGQVNLMAPEQFREVDERYQFLRGQLQDLESASRDLEQVTDQIRSESSALFLKSFHDIRAAFQTMFRRLFGGGRTELKLTDPDDVLGSGIEFYAQPPGKKLENIALLSGGERALTAVALLFALYRVRPSPFCILDEIDAALDDENVGRLVELLTEFAAHTQFLLITHNKRTAAGAAHLFGITMEEQGISRLVTLRLPAVERAQLAAVPEMAGAG